MSDDLIRNWSTSNTLITPYNLSNATQKVKVSICPIISLNFTVGKTSKENITYTVYCSNSVNLTINILHTLQYKILSDVSIEIV